MTRMKAVRLVERFVFFVLAMEFVTWIALFRGINVGGKNILSMVKLKEDLESLNCRKICTYIQSGNVVFDSMENDLKLLSQKITARIKARHGFEPHVLLLQASELREAIESNPFPEAIAAPKTLHFFFLDQSAVSVDIEAIEGAKSPSERYRLAERLFYLHAPDGIGRSKLAANAERYLGVVTTARNYRTVEKLASMVR